MPDWPTPVLISRRVLNWVRPYVSPIHGEDDRDTRRLHYCFHHSLHDRGLSPLQESGHPGRGRTQRVWNRQITQGQILPQLLHRDLLRRRARRPNSTPHRQIPEPGGDIPHFRVKEDEMLDLEVRDKALQALLLPAGPQTKQHHP